MAAVPEGKNETYDRYNIPPYSRKQSVNRAFWLAAFCAACCFVGGVSCSWICVNALLTALFILLLCVNEKKFSESFLRRFFGDGIFYFLTSVELSLLSYRVLTVGAGAHPLLLLLMLFLLLLCLVLFTVILQKSLRQGRFGKRQTPVISSVCVMAGATGVFLAPILLGGLSQQGLMIFIAAVLFVSSLCIGIGSLNLIEVMNYCATHSDRER